MGLEGVVHQLPRGRLSVAVPWDPILRTKRAAKQARQAAKKDRPAASTGNSAALSARHPGRQAPAAARTVASATETRPLVRETEGNQSRDKPMGRGANAKSKVNGKSGPTRYEKFLRDEAKSYYGALAPTEESDDENDDPELMAPHATPEVPVVADIKTANVVDPTPFATGTGEVPVHKAQSSQRNFTEPKRSGHATGSMDIKQQSMGAMADKKEKLVNTASATKEKRRKQIDANRTGLGALRQLAEEKSGLVQMSMARYMNAGGVDIEEASASYTEQAVLGTCIEEDQQHTPNIKDEVHQIPKKTSP
ncbi:hypothetical protein GN958_ATG11592 [Phytophthora infestans]|uniref:Uncharacterized protein n=1 Tax=Phytophthora infestans TaxID=4787 RepID=A0A8S9UIH0_PHYIN|nr:hypothetical protein GN958_ATG11592 [Phytophthora infestans]